MSCAQPSTPRARRDLSCSTNRSRLTCCDIRSPCWLSRRPTTSGTCPCGWGTAARRPLRSTRGLILRRNSKRSICSPHRRSAQGDFVHRTSSSTCSRGNPYGAQNPTTRLIVQARNMPTPHNHMLPISPVWGYAFNRTNPDLFAMGRALRARRAPRGLWRRRDAGSRARQGSRTTPPTPPQAQTAHGELRDVRRSG